MTLQRMRRAQADFQAGRYEKVLDALAEDRSAPALHLRGLAERRLGQTDKALQTLRQAVASSPRDPAVIRNFGLAARSAGAPLEALEAFKRATKLAPDFAAAWQSRGRAALDLERFDEAAEAYRRALEIDPASPVAQYGLACVLTDIGETAAAVDLLHTLQRAGRNDASVVFMLGRCALAQGNTAAAIEHFAAAHRAGPGEYSLRALAEALWMSGGTDAFTALIRSATALPALIPLAADLARQAEDYALANHVLAAANPPTIDGLAVQSWVAIDTDDPYAALALATQVLDAKPGHRVATAAAASALLMLGRPNEVLTVLKPLREAEPLNQHWLAFEATAIRLTDPGRYAELLNHGALVRAMELPIPDGFRDIDAFNAALLDELDKQRPFVRRPLGQSLRGGNQTSVDLLHMQTPAVQAYLQALRAPVAQYLAELDVAPTHPLALQRGSDFRIAECWSVELQAHGFHVSHVHPRGWLSSAYYVAVPPVDPEAAERHEGWLRVGEPPIKTEPPLGPDQYIEPKPGRLVLFPSFVWHGTVPFRSESRRVTAPFDIVPTQLS
ncbi:MAG: putative 2OG-Fe(II) oxygenase [Pseudomonadota bacterium]